jgi:truncated hemoglobin YjbI
LWLGGNALRSASPEFATQQIPQALREQISDEVLRDWLALFRHTALPIIGEELTRAWIEKAEPVAHQAAIIEERASAE